MKKMFLCLVLFVAALGMVWAEDVSFDASVSENKIPLGAPIKLTLTVHGTQDVSMIPPPVIDGFDVRFLGPSTQVSVVNGEYSTAKTFSYRLTPLREGKLVIPAVDVNIKGTAYRSQSIVVEVLPAQAVAQGGSSGVPADLASRVKLQMMTPRPSVYLREVVPVIMKLYVNGVELRNVSANIPGDGFDLIGFAQPKRYEEMLNGVKYQVLEFIAGIVPTRVGSVQVGPGLVDAAIPVRMQRGGGAFEDDFFQNFFGGFQQQPIRATADPLMLDVKALPAEGRPADFSGAVGQFDMQAEAAPASVKVGDPVTLKVTVRGADVKDVKISVPSADGFKLYDPQVKTAAGEYTLEQVFIPVKSEVKEVPAATFSYFDPARGQYQTLRKGPFPLTVAAPLPGEEFKAVAFSGSALPAVETFGQDIVFVKDRPGVWLSFKKEHKKDNVLFYLAIALYLNVWGALFVWRRRQLRLEKDGVYARRVRAPGEAARRMRSLLEIARREDSVAFSDETQRMLEAYLGDMLGLLPGDAATGALEQVFRKQGVPDAVLQDIVRVRNICDTVRFASARLSAKEMEDMVVLLKKAFQEIERRVA